MSKLIIKEIKNRIASFALVFTMLGSTAVGLTGCENNKQKAESSSTSKVYTVENPIPMDSDSKTLNPDIKTKVNFTYSKIEEMLPELNNEVKYDSSIMLLLDVIAKKDENGKISADLIEQLKSRVDVDSIINNFDILLDTVQKKIIIDEKVYRISSTLPEDLSADKEILVKLEDLLQNIIEYSKSSNKEELLNEFDKAYLLFVEEEEVEIYGSKFEIRDLGNTNRAVANNYGEAIAYYSRNYITDEQYKKMDERLNDQNNKAYIKTTGEILSNQVQEKSEIDVISELNEKCDEVKSELNGKVDVDEEAVEDLVNYANIKYLVSDKVATKDFNEIFRDFDSSDITDVLLLIDEMYEYNLNNNNDMVPFSDLLIDEYLKTGFGNTDKVALDFVLSNSIRLIKEKKTDVSYEELNRSPYFSNLYLYFTQQNFVHKYKDGEHYINFQEISEGAHLINYEIILKVLYKYNIISENDYYNYMDISKEHLQEAIQYLQNKIMGECERYELQDGSTLEISNNKVLLKKKGTK